MRNCAARRARNFQQPLCQRFGPLLLQARQPDYRDAGFADTGRPVGVREDYHGFNGQFGIAPRPCKVGCQFVFE